MRWEFHNESPIYAQVMERVERMIVSGALPPGERLPSVRVFAQEAGVNPNTMQKALTELERGGLIYSQRTSGHFVTEDQAVIARAREALAEMQTERFLQSMQELGFTSAETAELLHRKLEHKEEE
ncbi:MAG: GntR family transcriptional regulator [Oscillospiraceae bacterium]|jgi:DNA-binding transcriptional regulator YhcF (GntR family)|nr:GntR family transcriptional regulator [Oscillospiraceae bacterium]